jgi:hypothetical protein
LVGSGGADDSLGSLGTTGVDGGRLGGRLGGIPPPGVIVVPVKVTPQWGHCLYGGFGVLVSPREALHRSHVHL